MRIGIIGTAFRKDDYPRLALELYQKMERTLLHVISLQYELCDFSNTVFVSGGAAGADTLITADFLLPYQKEIHLPGDKNDSKTLEYYHNQFMKKTGINSFYKTLNLANTRYTSKGTYKERNLRVADVDLLIAFTFGSSPTDLFSELAGKDGPYFSHYSFINSVSSKEAGLKPGGTAHTWDYSRALKKIHVNLNT